MCLGETLYSLEKQANPGRPGKYDHSACGHMYIIVVFTIRSALQSTMKGTKVHNPRAILSLLKLIWFLVHEIHDIVTKL